MRRTKLKSLWRGIKNSATNLGAALNLGLGIAITIGGIAIACYAPQFLSLPIAALGGFIGGFVIARAIPHFVPDPSSDKGKLEEAEVGLEEEKLANRMLAVKLREVQDENAKLQHRLATFANITKIHPVMKLVTGELAFDITDFYEKKLDVNEGKPPVKHLLSRKYHEMIEFYRGVYKYSGKLNLAVDLANIKVVETDREITICGPFDYKPLLDLDRKAKWLMHGRREQEFRHGKSEDDLETYEIKVTKVRDQEIAEEQISALRENLKAIKIIEPMRVFTDRLVVEFVRLMLAPTGKSIKYSPVANDFYSVKTLGELVAAFNDKIGQLLPSKALVPLAS